jgi:hypothetical protein
MNFLQLKIVTLAETGDSDADKHMGFLPSEHPAIINNIFPKHQHLMILKFEHKHSVSKGQTHFSLASN